MKKAYLEPTIDVIKVKEQTLLVVSGDTGNVNNVTIEGDFTGNDNDILSRQGYSVWDDEDDY